MDSIELTKAQESIIIDFIKRWGVDSPELVAEMLDHYCELAKEEMGKGVPFQTAVNRWKTKQTLWEFRTIQKSYEKRLSKAWKKDHKEAWRSVLLGKPILLLIPVYFVLVIALTSVTLNFWLFWAFAIKTVLAVLLTLYIFTFDKRKSRIYGFSRLSIYGGLNLQVIVQMEVSQLLEKTYLSGIPLSKAYVFAGFMLLSIVSDIVYYRLYTKVKNKSAHLSDEMLEAFKLQRDVS